MIDGELIAGIDEAGRGAVAGPVVAGACILSEPLVRRRHVFPAWSPDRRRHRGMPFLIADSKLLSPAERASTFAWLSLHCAFGLGIVEAEVIERVGILRATERAMHLALIDLERHAKPVALLVDGCDAFRFPLPHTSIIRGDRLHPAIAAASIIAKVTRDRLMIERSEWYPAYAFHAHKGYGTSGHLLLIKKHGPCSLHRLSFLQRILTDCSE